MGRVKSDAKVGELAPSGRIVRLSRHAPRRSAIRDRPSQSIHRGHKATASDGSSLSHTRMLAGGARVGAHPCFLARRLPPPPTYFCDVGTRRHCAPTWGSFKQPSRCRKACQ